MDRLRTRKRRKVVVESDDEHLDDELHREWEPFDSENDHQIFEHDNDKSLPEEFDFDSTVGFQLKNIKSTKPSTHPIWFMYGNLMKDDKIVNKVKHRIYCKKCFEKQKFKRYV